MHIIPDFFKFVALETVITSNESEMEMTRPADILPAISGVRYVPITLYYHKKDTN